MQKISYEKIYDAVRQIPSGHVATYGQIAALCGSPKAARVVGNALHNNPDPINTPCFRVVNGKGNLAARFGFGGKVRQKEMLENDGVPVVNFRVDLSEYQWDGIGFLGEDTLCPVCLRHHFTEKNAYEICSVCGWEDDPVQRRNPDFAGGANTLSLNQARLLFGKKAVE